MSLILIVILKLSITKFKVNKLKKYISKFDEISKIFYQKFVMLTNFIHSNIFI